MDVQHSFFELVLDPLHYLPLQATVPVAGREFAKGKGARLWFLHERAPFFGAASWDDFVRGFRRPPGAALRFRLACSSS